MIDQAPLPSTSVGFEAPFWAGMAEGILRIQHCAACGEWLFPPRVRCSRCGGTMDWRPTRGRGVIWSYTVVHPPVLPAFAAFTPYPVVVVELEEQRGLRLAGNLLAADGAAINSVAPEHIRIGAPVTLSIRDLGGALWPTWRLAARAIESR